MALPASGQISLSQVAVELGRASNATTSLGESAVRSLAGVPSGAISLDNLHGKSAAFAATITTSQQELNLATWASANGWNGSASATITINSGVYIWSDNTATPALTTGSFPGGLTIINNGYIMGKGGLGGGNQASPFLGGNGGNAISLSCATTISSSSGYIGGGGGGGGGSNNGIVGGGGGAGGGNGGYGYNNGSIGASGAGGGIGVSGSNGSGPSGINAAVGGGGGGRLFQATTKAGPSAGATKGSNLPGYGNSGGGTGGLVSTTGGSTTGGSGGGDGISGGNGTWPSGTTGAVGGGGGGFGASGGSGGNVNTSTPGGSAGKAVALNGYVVSWSGGFPSTKVFGAVS